MRAHLTLLLLSPLALAGCGTEGSSSKVSTPGTETDTAAEDGFVCPPVGDPPDIATDQWTAAGVAPGGDIAYLSAVATRSDRLYAGSPDNGLYRSDDGGALWLKLPVFVTHMRGPIATHPTEADRAAISTGVVWMTENAGQNWRELPGVGGLLPETEIHGLTWDDDRLWAIDGASRIFWSDDFGETWDSPGDITPIVPEPPDLSHESDRWWGLHAENGTLYGIQHTGSLWRSDDGGVEWTELLTPDEGSLSHRTLSVDGDEVRVGSWDTIYWSTDRGETFTAIPLDAHAEPNGISPHPDGWLLVSGHHGIYRVDRDGTLTTLWAGDDTEPKSALVDSDGTLIIGHRQGIYQSTDGGATWDDRNEGLRDDDLATLWVHPQCPGVVWSGTQCERGLFKSTDWGASWNHEPTYMHYTMVVADNPSRPDEVWITTDDHVLFSRTLGELWIEAIPEDMRYHFHGLAIDPFAPDTVLIGSVGSGAYADAAMQVYRTDDSGQTWTVSSEGIPASDASAHALLFSPTQPGVVLLGTYMGGDISHMGPNPGIGLYRSTDHGLSWTAVEGSPDNISQLEACDGHTYAATSDGVLYSNDDGQTWTNLWSGSDEVLSVDCLGDRVAAWSGDGAFLYSEDRGTTWVDWSDGLPIIPNPGFSRLYDVQFSPDGQLLYFAFRGEGVFWRGL